MPYIRPQLIDCSMQADLLARWPVAAQLRTSETAEALMADLARQGWTLAGADLDGEPFDINPEERSMTVDTGGLALAAIKRSRHFQNILALRTMTALRAAWQAERADDALNMHRVDVWPLLYRILAADRLAMTLRMAHELRDHGHEAVWRHAMGDECGDAAAAYARALGRRKGPGHEAAAMASAFLQWFEKDARVAVSDFEALSDMDALLADLDFNGVRMPGEGAVRCLTADPLGGDSYLGATAGDLAGNPAWRIIRDPVAEAHFSQILDEIGTTRIGHVAMRDGKLAARLFPDAVISA